MKRLNRKKTIIFTCIVIPSVLAAIFILKAVKAKKCRRYSAAGF